MGGGGKDVEENLITAISLPEQTNENPYTFLGKRRIF